MCSTKSEVASLTFILLVPLVFLKPIQTNPIRANFCTPFNESSYNGWRAAYFLTTLKSRQATSPAGFRSSTLPPTFQSTAPQKLAVTAFYSNWTCANPQRSQRSRGTRTTRTKYNWRMFQSQQKQLTTLWTAKLSHKVCQTSIAIDAQLKVITSCATE